MGVHSQRCTAKVAAYGGPTVHTPSTHSAAPPQAMERAMNTSSRKAHNNQIGNKNAKKTKQMSNMSEPGQHQDMFAMQAWQTKNEIQ
eukprot:921584-Pelagomonas_calceolata.AAC.2